MTYPLIGNYGVNHEDNESSRPWAEAFVVRKLCPSRAAISAARATLNDYLKENNITGIQGVDTRAHDQDPPQPGQHERHDHLCGAF